MYDEWDFRASDYRLRWCRVREVPLEEGTPEFYEATLDEYAQLLSQIRGRFEQLNPRSPRKVKRLNDGEDIDFDALIDFVIGANTHSPRSITILLSLTSITFAL